MYLIISLSAKGYAWVGMVSAPLIVAPILWVPLWRGLRTARTPTVAAEG